jgi:hypothetical protein
VARAVNLIVSCTNRKRYEVAPGMAVHELRGPDLQKRLQVWKERLRCVPAEEYPVDEVYMGEHWSVVRTIPQEASRNGWNVRLWVCSAGYGLIRTDTRIKAYQATFSPGVQDYVASGASNPTGILQEWWEGVCSYRLRKQDSATRSLSALAATFPRTPMIVALSVDYLKAVESDLLGALRNGFFKKHLLIVSCGTQRPHPTWKENLLPCDARLAGALGGTLSSLNARVARFLFRSARDVEPTVERMSSLVQSIERQPRSILARAPKSTIEVAGFIQLHLRRNPDISKTRLLEEFRGSGSACEQRRFGEIYAKLRREVASERHA